MQSGFIISIIILIALSCYEVYDDLPSKCTKIEECFEGFMNKSLVRFKMEKSPVHTIVYGAGNTSKTYFVKQHLNLDSEEEEEHKKKIIVVCKDEKEWTYPETGMHYDGFNMCGIDMITSENIDHFDNCLIVIDDMGNKLESDMAEYIAGVRYDDTQKIVMGHKPARIVNTARRSCHFIYITTYYGADLFKNFNDIYTCKHVFYGIIKELKRSF